MFGKKQTKTYDKDTQIPVIRCSICTGEQAAGFKDKKNGKFSDVTLIQNEAELKRFMKEYGIEELISKNIYDRIIM